MNFINVKLEGGHIVTNGLNLKVPEGALKVLKEKGYDGKELIFGIRPEDVNTEAAFLETFPESVVRATISVSELLGSESHLYCQVGDNEFIAKVDARDYLGTGATIELGFDLNKAHFFDKETEKTEMVAFRTDSGNVSRKAASVFTSSGRIPKINSLPS